MPGYSIFQPVTTIYGLGYIQDIRPDCFIVFLTNWHLAQGQSPTLYLQEEAISPARIDQLKPDGVDITTINWKFAFTPKLSEGDEVMTVYGQGFVEKQRKQKNDFVVKLRSWKLAQGQSPTLYLTSSSCVKIPGLQIGSIAETVCGLVKVLSIQRDGKHVCEAINWHLADGKAPTLYLAPEAFALISTTYGL